VFSVKRWKITVIFFGIFSGLVGSALISTAWAVSPLDSLPFSLADFGAPAQLLTDDITLALVRPVGFALAHRPYRPATPLGTDFGLDFGAEVTLVKLDPKFAEALQTAQLSSASLPPSIPIPRFQVHKGVGNWLDLGISWIGYSNFIQVYGGDVQVSIYHPTEGPSVAVRFNYSQGNLGFIKVKTLSPQVIVSKKLAYVDPYIGIGYLRTTGEVNIESLLGPLAPYASLLGIVTKNSATAQAFQAFIGLPFVIGPTGLRIAFEGSFVSNGIHMFGTRIGFQF